MILDSIMGVISAILAPIFSLLPTWSLSSIVTSFGTAGSDIGEYLGMFNSILPITEILIALLAVYTFVMPGLMAYKVAEWVWRHIPHLWGFGT